VRNSILILLEEREQYRQENLGLQHYRQQCVLLQQHNLQLQHELGVLKGKEEKQEENLDDRLEEDRRGMRRSSPDGREGEGAVQFTMRDLEQGLAQLKTKFTQVEHELRSGKSSAKA